MKKNSHFKGGIVMKTSNKKKREKKKSTPIITVTVFGGCVECVKIGHKRVAYKVKDLDI